MMNEGELYCNSKQCRRLISSIAWVTFCSHLFCEEDGTSHLRQLPCLCPACGATLSLKGDIIRVDLDPPEQFKNMVLAGLKPEIIMDICTRSLNFWSYQMTKERQRQLQNVSQLKHQISELEKYYEKIIRNMNADVQSANKQLEHAFKERNAEMLQKETMSLKLAEKSRQYQKLKILYDSLRRRVNIPPLSMEEKNPSGASQESVRSKIPEDALMPYGSQNWAIKRINHLRQANSKDTVEIRPQSISPFHRSSSHECRQPPHSFLNLYGPETPIVVGLQNGIQIRQQDNKFTQNPALLPVFSPSNSGFKFHPKMNTQ